jgi:group I intron endonuclease
MESCIYIFTSPSGKSYIGKTTNFSKRKADHVNYSHNKESQLPFHRAIREYGIDKFQQEVIECEENELDNFERLFIGVFKGIGKIYNCTDGGEGIKGWHHPPEICKKIGQKGLGRKHSDETKNKMSLAHKGKVLSAEWKSKISASHVGIKHTQAAKDKLSIWRSGRKQTPEHVANMIAAKQRARREREKLEYENN